MEQCYGTEDQRTLDAKADWERALRAHRQAQEEDAHAEQRLLESKQHMERLQRNLSRAQEDVLAQKTLIHNKQDEFVHAAAKLDELQRTKQRLELLVQEADHAHRNRAQQIYAADSTRDARERHTRAICTLLGEDTPRNLPASHVQSCAASFGALHDAVSAHRANQAEAHRPTDPAPTATSPNPPIKKGRGNQGENATPNAPQLCSRLYRKTPAAEADTAQTRYDGEPPTAQADTGSHTHTAGSSTDPSPHHLRQQL